VGTAVHVYLPRAEGATPAAEQSAPEIRPAAPRGARILLVDDDNAVREVTAAMLSDLGYLVTEADSGNAALGLLDKGAGVDLMIIDFAMPGMSGAELARYVRNRRPELPLLFVTGFAERKGLAELHDGHVVSKPFVSDELVDKVQRALTGGLP
jgi:CheY-like chemotaxis protein